MLGHQHVEHWPQSWTWNSLTHWGPVTHICVSKLTSIGSDNEWLVAWPVPSHYLNQCLHIVNWTLGIKLQWNFSRNSNIFIHENAFESIVCEMATILSWPQCVKLHRLSDISNIFSLMRQQFSKWLTGAVNSWGTPMPIFNKSPGPNALGN